MNDSTGALTVEVSGMVCRSMMMSNQVVVQFRNTEHLILDLARQARSLQNAACPVMHLHPAILTTIFAMLQKPPRETKVERYRSSWAMLRRNRQPTTWHAVTQVCRRWRKIAQNCPSLWTNIHFTRFSGYSHMPEYIRLSCSELLVIQLELCTDFRGTDFEEGIGLFVNRNLPAVMHRTRELDIYGESTASQRMAFTELNTSSLETLIIQCNQDRLSSKPMDARLPQVFQGHLPSLKYLWLDRFTAFSPGNFTNLKQLHLSDLPILKVSHLRSVLDLLHANPTLENLMLEEVILPPVAPRKKGEPYDFTVTPPGGQHASLPALRKLTFRRTITSVVRR